MLESKGLVDEEPAIPAEEETSVVDVEAEAAEKQKKLKNNIF
jgi:hypothetical protein